MLFYKGTKASGYLQPRTLASYDLVITTYTVLQSETSYVDLPHTNSSEGRRFRNPKRFMAVPAPLPCINWSVRHHSFGVTFLQYCSHQYWMGTINYFKLFALSTG